MIGLQIYDLHEKNLPRDNVQAYFAAAFSDEEKKFLTSTIDRQRHCQNRWNRGVLGNF
jgi:hypothetical protein